MKIAALAAAVGISALALAPHAAADFDNGGRFKTQTPPMLCEIGPDALATPGADGVVCQGAFPQAPIDSNCGGDSRRGPCNPPLHQDQAVVTSQGQFAYRDANIGIGDNPTLNTLMPGQQVTIRGWTATGSQDGVNVTNPTGHGMQVHADGTVVAF